MDKTRGLWRGKRLNNGEWYHGIDVMRKPVRGELCLCNPGEDWISVDPSTLGECVGFPDKNDNAAFEDDLVKDNSNGVIGVIRYGEYRQPFNDDESTKHIGFYVDWLEETVKLFLRADLGYWLPLVEIIGNIHDNPEMLKGG